MATQPALGPARRVRLWTTPERLLIVAIGVFGAFQLFVSLYKLESVQAGAMDLGYIEQVLWKISHGNWWAYSSVFQTPGIAGDGSVALYPLAYGFRYLGGSTFLFVVQAVGTGLATWGVYRAAALASIKGSMAVVLALGFMLAPGILGGSQFDFHPDFVALPFTIWAYVAYRRGRLGPYYVLALVAVLSKNMALFGFFGWGVGLLLWRRRYRDGLIALGATLALMGIEFGWLIPHVFHAQTQVADARAYAYLGHGFVGVAEGLPTHVLSVMSHLVADPTYWLLVLGPTIGICLLGRESVPAALTLLVLNAASTFSPQHMMTTQYQVLLTGWLALATVEAVTRWPQKRRWMIALIAVATTAFQVNLLDVGIAPVFAAPLGEAAAIRQAEATIPTRTVVWAPDRAGAYLYRFPVFGQDAPALPGLLMDSLPTLWREAGTHRTALLGFEPASPYFAQVLERAVRSGYRVAEHLGPVFVLKGNRTFEPGVPQTYSSVIEPAGRTWVIPSWTQATAVGLVEWRKGLVEATPGRHGYLIRPFRLGLRGGKYRLTVQLIPPTMSGPKVIVGVVLWSAGLDRRFPIWSGSGPIVENLVVRHPGWVVVGVVVNDRAGFDIGNITIQRESQ